MGGSRTIVCCKPCNDRFGHKFEAKAAQLFQRLHFYFACQGLLLKVPNIRWKEAFTLDGRQYDAIFEDGAAKFTLSRPVVSIDSGIMNAEFGSKAQMKPVLASLRKKHGISPTPGLEITPAMMPKTDIRIGPEVLMLAIKMCSALATLLPDFGPDELYVSSNAPGRFMGQATYDFRQHFPDKELAPDLCHVIYVERTRSGLQGIVRFFGVYQFHCHIGPATELRSSAGFLATLDPVTGTESFVTILPRNLDPPPAKIAENALDAALALWTMQLSQVARRRGASDAFDVALRNNRNS